MSTTQALHAAGSVRPVGFRMWADRYFYFFMSLLTAVVVVYGFSHTISQALFHPGIRPPALLWVHGAVFFGWLGLFILQSALVRTRNVKVHKRLGWYFAGVGAAIPVLGVAITRVMALFEINIRHYDLIERLGFLAIPLQDMVAFTAAFGLAILWRRRPEYHRRLVLIATCALTAAAWGRLPALINLPYISFYAGVDGLIVLGALRDLIVNRRVHAVYLSFLPPLVLLQLGTVAIAQQRPEWWLRIGRAFLGLGG
jgi:hypothetical protein